MELIDKDDLYGDKYNAFVLCEYTREMKLIKRLIEIAEAGVSKKSTYDTWSFDGVCYQFAKTIVDYSKMAYDNLVLGHFHATNMINRSILENCVCLDLIVNNDEQELWKYYLAYSFRSVFCRSKRQPTNNELQRLEERYKDLGVEEDFYKTQKGRKRPYIKEAYGWTYKINSKFSFAGVCELVGQGEYLGFSLMSEYSHGTSLHTKLGSSIFVEFVMSMFVSLYIELYRMVTLFCWDTVDASFDEVSEELEEIFYRFIEYEDEFVYKE